MRKLRPCTIGVSKWLATTGTEISPCVVYSLAIDSCNKQNKSKVGKKRIIVLHYSFLLTVSVFALYRLALE